MVRSLYPGYFALRWEILERDNFTCQYCGRSAPDVKLEVDHVIPVADGGTDNPDNLKTSCYACNRGKAGLIMRKNGLNAVAAIPVSRQGQALSFIAARDGTIGRELAQGLDITLANAKQVLHRLKSRGHIERTTSGWKTTKQ